MGVICLSVCEKFEKIPREIQSVFSEKYLFANTICLFAVCSLSTTGSLYLLVTKTLHLINADDDDDDFYYNTFFCNLYLIEHTNTRKRKYKNTNTTPKTFWRRPLRLKAMTAADRRRQGLRAQQILRILDGDPPTTQLAAKYANTYTHKYVYTKCICV